MQRVVLLPLLYLSLIAGQHSVGQQDFKTTEAHYRVGHYEIVIRQKKYLYDLTQPKFNADPKATWCSASVEIKRNGKIMDRLDFNNIMAFGHFYGIHLPKKQESSKHLILVKYGDYDSRILVITDKGKLFNIAGRTYRIFLGRYLIAQGAWAESSPSFSILDLYRNKLPLTVDWGAPIMVKQPAPHDGKVFIIKLYTNGPELFASIDMVDERTVETVEHTGYFYKIDLETGKIVDAVFDGKKHTEFVIDYSNIDLSCDCESGVEIIK